MDFHRLSRRELQALCKRNKIPANMTNVAMVDSLKSLQIVEGIDEFLQVCESEMAQASIESRMRSEVAPPFRPPTVGRSAHKRNKETTVTSENKMDSMLKDCAHKGVLLTPAPKSRRKAVKEDSTVKKVCGTRRSARLAEKSARLLKGVEDGNSDFSKRGLFTDEYHQVLKVNLKESLDESDEVSGVTDVTERANMEENSEKKDEEQVDSAEKQDIATDIEENRNRFNTEDGDIADMKEHSNEKAHIEVFPCEKEVVTTVEEVHLVPKIQEIKNNQPGDEEEAELGQKEHSFVEIKEGGAGSENSDLRAVDAITTVVDNSEQKAHEEVVQCEKEVVSVEEEKLVLTVEEEKNNHSGADDAKTEQKDTTVEIDQEGCGLEIDAKIALKDTVVKFEREDCGSEIDAKTELEDTDVEIEQVDCDSDIDTEFDAKTELKDTDVEIEREDCDSDFDTEFDSKAELKDTDVEIEQEDCGSDFDTEFDAKTELKDTDDEIEQEDCGSDFDTEFDAETELKDTDVEIEREGCGSEIDAEFDDIEVSETDTRVKDNTSLDARADVESEAGMHEDSSETSSNLNESDSDSSEVESNLNESDSDSSETKSTESSYSLAVASDYYTTDEEVLVIDEEQVISHVAVQESKEIGEAIDRAPSVVDDDLPPPINVKSVPTPIRASASNTSSTMQERMAAAASDNKENIGSESKTKTKILIKDIKEAAINLGEIGQLSKKFNEVCLTPKLDKNECVDEVSARPALQVLPHNQKTD